MTDYTKTRETGGSSRGRTTETKRLLAAVKERSTLFPPWSHEAGVFRSWVEFAENNRLEQIDLGNYWSSGELRFSGCNLYLPYHDLDRMLEGFESIASHIWGSSLAASTRVLTSDVVLKLAGRALTSIQYAIIGIDIADKPEQTRMKLWMQGSIREPAALDHNGVCLSKLASGANGALVGCDITIANGKLLFQSKRYLIMRWTEQIPTQVHNSFKLLLGTKGYALLEQASFVILGAYRGDIQVHFRVEKFHSFYSILSPLVEDTLPAPNHPFFFGGESMLIAIPRRNLLAHSPLRTLTSYWFAVRKKD